MTIAMETRMFGKTPQELAEIIRWWETGATPEADTLMREVLKLRGKVSFYESRIAQLAAVINQD